MDSPLDSSANLENATLGPFRLLKVIGEGRTSVVYQAERIDFAQRVAVKLFHDEVVLGDLDAGTRGERALLGTLSHPHIVQALDEGTVQHRRYLVMEFVDGEVIDTYCDAHRLTLKARIELLQQLLEGLEHAHARLVAHRDLKPANLLVNTDGMVKILDFGSAAGESAGFTPDFASPEQRANKPITLTSDIYSVGLIARLLLAGISPKAPPSELPSRFLAGTGAVESAKIAGLRGVTASGLISQLRGDLDAICTKALQTDPDLRYPSAESFRTDLRAFLTGHPVAARHNGRWIGIGKWAHRNRVLAGLLATAAVVLLVCVTGVTWQSIKASHERRIARERLRDLVKLTGSLDGELYESVRSLPDASQPRASLLAGTKAALDSISETDRSDPVLTLELATQYGRLAQLEQERGEPGKAHDDLVRGVAMLQTIPHSSDVFDAAQREMKTLQAMQQPGTR